MFADKYFQLKKKGTFGWTQLRYVADLDKAAKAGPSVGLYGAGMLWIDDVTMEKVDADVKTTAEPALGKEEAPIAPPGPLGEGAVHCPRCAYRNMPAWKKCYACGTALETKQRTVAGPPVKPLTSFENGNPFSGGGWLRRTRRTGRRRCASTGASRRGRRRRIGRGTTI